MWQLRRLELVLTGKAVSRSFSSKNQNVLIAVAGGKVANDESIISNFVGFSGRDNCALAIASAGHLVRSSCRLFPASKQNSSGV